MKKTLTLFILLLSIAGFGQVNLNDGLVANYPFSGNANDAGPLANNGTVVGATLTTDRFGANNSAYFFDGTDYINVDNLVNDLQGKNTYSITGWFQPSLVGGLSPRDVVGIIFAINREPSVGVGQNVLQVQITGAGDLYYQSDAGTYAVNVTNQGLELDRWYFFYLVYNKNGNSSLFLSNAIETQRLTGPLEINATDRASIGQEYDGAATSQNWRGKIDDLRIYDRALTNDELVFLGPPLPPQALPATTNTTTSFLSRWTAVPGASGYRLDATATTNFSTFLAGFNSKVVAGTSDVIGGLTSGTDYRYRVRAVNANGESLSSNVILNRAGSPDPATAIAATSITSAGFTARWNTAAGATGYRLDVSADNFTTFVTNFNDRAVASTNQAVTGLSPTTTYQYRVRATNAVGASANSNVVSVTTLQACPAIAVSITSSNKTNFTFAATGGQAPYLFSIDGVNFLPANNFTLTAGTYNVIARDANGCTGTSDFVINGIVDCGVTQASGGQGTTFTTHILGSGAGTVRITYEMFSIPDQLDVFYDNVLVASTNGLVSGSATLSFNYTYNPAKPNFCVIRVTAPNSGTAWNYAAFCPAIPVPVISSFSPASGGPGTTVTINGQNLAGVTSVKFGAVNAPVVTNTGTIITVNVPTGAVTAPLLITNTFGTSESTNAFVVSPYCFSGATNLDDSRISKVVLGSINNDTSGQCGAYSDFTNQVAFLSPGQATTIAVTAGTCGGNFDKIGKIFVDWNGDFDFDDAGELMGTSSVINGTLEVVAPFNVPAGAVVGTTVRMRVVLEETTLANDVTACGTYAYGETEDYSITIISSGSPSRTVAPVALPDFSAVVGTPSAARTFGLSASNAGTNAFTITAPAQFQVALADAGPYGNSVTVTPVSGAVSATVFVRYAPAAAGTNSGNVTVSHPSFTTVNVAVAGSSTASTISLNWFAAFDDFISSGINAPSTNQSLRIVGTALTGNVSVTAPAQFQVSLNGTTFLNSLQLTPTSGALSQQLFVRYNPSVAGPHSGNITIATTGVSTANIPVSGSFLAVPTGLLAGFIANAGFQLTWNEIPQIREYRLDVSTSSTFTSFVAGWQNAPLTVFNFAGRADWNILGLTPSTQYFVRLRAVYPSGTSGNSDVLSFTTSANPALISANQWINTFGAAGNETFVNALANDPEGNVYAVGKFGGSITLGATTLTSQGDADMFIAKYNPAGALQWAKSIGGIGTDEAWHVSVEGNGVFVSGVFDATVDFDPDGGVTLVSTRGPGAYPGLPALDDGFVARFNATTGGLVWAKGIGDAWPPFYTRGLATWTNPGDGSIGVFLTGMFSGTNDFDPGAGTTNLTSQGNTDVFIMRLAGASGDFSWANSMGSANFDSGTALVTDGSNLYATGFYYGDIDLDPGSGTVNASGQGSYLNRFNGNTGALIYARSLSSTGELRGYDIARDNTHIYLVGALFGAADLDPNAGVTTLTGNGGFLAKYLLADGSLAWANLLSATSYMSPTRVIADQTGLYVGGDFQWIADFDPGVGSANRIGNSGDIFIARYNSANGGFVWAKNIGGNGYDAIRAGMSLANDGLYVGGMFQNTVNFDPYTNTLNRTATGTFGGFIAKYQTTSPPAPAAPVLQSPAFVSNRGWLLRWNGVADVNSYRVDVATDVGFSNQVNTNSQMRVTPSTALLSNTWWGFAPGTTYFIRMRSEAAGGITSANSNVISLTTNAHPADQSGNLWTSTFGSSGNEQTTAVTTDGSGNVYSVGYFSGPITIGGTNLAHAGGQDAFFIKYNSTGTVQWAKSLGSAQNEELWAAATDATGLYVYGFLTSPGLDVDPNSGVTTLTGSGTIANAFIAKYSLTDGALIWAIPLGDVSVITGNPLVSDGTNVYVTGSFFNTVDFDPGAGTQTRASNGGEDAFIARYNAANGNFGWVTTFGGTANDRGYSLSLAGGAIFASGFYAQGADLDTGAGTNIPAAGGAFLSRFNTADGTHTWSKALVGDVIGYGISTDATSVYLVGAFSATVDFDPDAGTQNLSSFFSFSDDGFLARYSQATGAYQFAKSLPSSDQIIPRKIVSNASGLFVAGSSFASGDFDPNFSEANRTSLAQDAFLAHYTTDGNLVFAKTIGEFGTEAIRGGLWLGTDGVYIGGSYQNAVNFDPYLGSVQRVASGGIDAFVAKYAIQTAVPSAPTANAATNVASTSFTANWAFVATASSYRLDVSTVNTFATFLAGYQDVTVGTNNFTVSGLSPSTQYFYRVRALNTAGVSTNSNVINLFTTAAALAAPTANAASSINANSFTANWSAVSGATGYRLDVSTDGFLSFVPGYNNKLITAASDVVSGLASSTAYQYRVRAVNAGGASGNSNIVNVTTASSIPPVPTAVAATSITQTGFVANWNASTGATGYQIDISTNNFVSFVAGYSSKSVTATNEPVTGLTPGETYQYRVRAVNGGGVSSNSNVVSVTTLLPAPAAPVATAANGISSSAFTANWNAVSGATGYLLDVSSDNFTSFAPGYNGRPVVLTSEPVAGLNPATGYRYRVRATNTGGTSGNSNVIDVTTLNSALSTPTALAATNIQQTSFTANWNTLVGATGYLLSVSADDFATFIPGYNQRVVSGISESVTGLQNNTTYKYRVMGTGATGNSPFSNIITVQTSTPIPPPPAPVATAATSVSATGFTANWNAVTGATGYRLDVSLDNFATFVSGFNDKTVSTTSDAVTGLTVGTSYKYRVRAVNANAASINSNVIDVTTLAPPPAPVATAATLITTSGFTANWNPVSGATTYRLDVSADNFVTFITGFNDKEVTATSDAITGLLSGTSYKYRVRAVGATGTSASSNVIDVTTIPLPPPPFANSASTVSVTGFTASWTPVAVATSYRLDVSADNFTTFVAGFENKTVSSTSDEITGLTAATAYKYRVRSVNANGASTNSNVVDVTTLPKQGQTITFGALADRTVGDAAFTLSATASSALAVSFESLTTGKVTVSGNTVTIVAAGTATIRAKQEGNTIFNAAANVDRSFCIRPAKPTITLTNANTETPTLTSSAAAGNQWFLNGTAISGATNATLVVTQAGVYTVRSTIETCASELSNAQAIIVTGDITTGHESMRVYPNPVSDRLYVALKSFARGSEVQVRLVDMNGKVLQQQTGLGGETVELSMAGYAEGSYLVAAEQGAVRSQVKIVKE